MPQLDERRMTPDMLRNMGDGSKARAKTLLLHYISTLWSHTSLKWDEGNTELLDTIVDDIDEMITYRFRELLLRDRQDRTSPFQGEDNLSGGDS